jgi:hypothetical protein
VRPQLSRSGMQSSAIRCLVPAWRPAVAPRKPVGQWMLLTATSDRKHLMWIVRASGDCLQLQETSRRKAMLQRSVRQTPISVPRWTIGSCPSSWCSF